MKNNYEPQDLHQAMGLVIEECGEVCQALGKIMRFGFMPTDPNTNIPYNNLNDLRDEMGDATEAMSLLSTFLDKSFGHDQRFGG